MSPKAPLEAAAATGPRRAGRIARGWLIVVLAGLGLAVLAGLLRAGPQRPWSLLAAAALGALLAALLAAGWDLRRTRQLEAAGQQGRLSDLLPQMLWIGNEHAELEYVNQRWTQFSGEPAQRLLGHGWMDLLHPEDRARFMDVWHAALASGADTLPDYRLRRADGSYRWCTACFSTSRDAQGRAVRWFGTSMDVDRLHHASRALARSEQFYRSTLAALNEGVVAYDLQGRATASNPAAQALLGLTAADILGRPSVEWGLQAIDAKGQALVGGDTPAARALATGQPWRDIVIFITRRDGEQLWISVNAEPVHGGPDGSVSGVVSSFSDVTTQRLAHQTELQRRSELEHEVHIRTRELRALNQQLQSAERFARLVADSVPGRLMYWDTALRCRFVNRAQSDWHDEPPEHVLGRTLREIRGAAFADRVAPRFAAAFSGQALEFEQVEHSAHGVSVNTRVQYIPDQREGEVRGVVVLVSNITPQKHAEQLLRVRHEQLEQARDRADAANQAKTTFLANMSHEIRTPMNAILGYTHMLRREIADPAQQQRLDRVAGAAGHLLQVINDILDLSKIEAGKLVLDQRDFSLAALLTRTIAMVIEAAREKNLELLVHVDPLPDGLHGDATRLMQALLNLLSNAVKFTERGVVALRVQLQGPEHEHELTLRFEVRDTGIGIAPHSVADLFSPFAQVDGSRTRTHGGTGLGLVITQRIAELMGGETGVQSEPGQGSCFWFTARVGVAAQQEVVVATALAGLRALVVDDLAPVREALASMTHDLGLRVDSADSGAQALQMAASAAAAGDPYALVLLDWVMPALDGLQTGTRLAQAPTPPRAMVLLSTLERASVHQLAREAGFGAVLMKPISSRVLRNTLLRLLTGRREGPRTSAAGDLGALQLVGAAGARILLAEDNPVNQEVAVQLLQAAGVSVELAGDGAQALEMVRMRPYDLVLMDVQMPRMDGLEAARQIRLDPALAHLPIIAMTANAFAEDRRDCLDAGMNDHLAKPVDPRVLQATLQRWLPARFSAGQAAPIAPEAAAAPAPAQFDGLAGLLDLRVALECTGGRPASLLRVLQQFAAHYRDVGPMLVARLDADERPELARSLHSLRGIGATIGATRLCALARTLEAGLEQGQPMASLRQDATALCEELQALLAAVAECLDVPG